MGALACRARFGPSLALMMAAACGPPARGEAPAPERWSTMSKDERLAYMTDVVMPRTKSVFEAYDPHRFARMSCASCHGRDGSERGFVMPNPDLLLEPTAWNLGTARPETAPSVLDAFMARRVVPEMEALLGPASARCFACHTPER